MKRIKIGVLLFAAVAILVACASPATTSKEDDTFKRIENVVPEGVSIHRLECTGTQIEVHGFVEANRRLAVFMHNLEGIDLKSELQKFRRDGEWIRYLLTIEKNCTPAVKTYAENRH